MTDKANTGVEGRVLTDRELDDIEKYYKFELASKRPLTLRERDIQWARISSERGHSDFIRLFVTLQHERHLQAQARAYEPLVAAAEAYEAAYTERLRTDTLAAAIANHEAKNALLAIARAPSTPDGVSEGTP